MIYCRAGDTPPDWCELRQFAVYALGPGDTERLPRSGARERILITRGRCQIRAGDHSMIARAGQFMDLPDGVAHWAVTGSTDNSEFLHMAGNWGREIAGCGLWSLQNEPDPSDQGDVVDYPKQTRMDSHYHDYDEYWFILDGAATVVVSGQHINVTAGDCVATGAGHHHDMPDVKTPMRGAFFETTLLGQKRLGHLWSHRHGAATPDPIKI